MAAYEFIKPPLFLALAKKPPHEPIMASRLANFATGKAEPHPSHKEWLRNQVAPLLISQSGSWVELVGHASAIGDARANMELSKRRVQQVETAIRSVAPDCERYKRFAKGEQESGIVQSGNSPSFRSVEVIVYGPSVPKPVQPTVATETRLFYRETLEKLMRVQTRYRSDDGIPAGLYDSFRDVNARVQQHPCERPDPDLGYATTTRYLDVDSAFVMVSATISKVWKYYPPEQSVPETWYKSDITRKYTFTYGPGQSGQKVLVWRDEMFIKADGRATAPSHTSFYATQPPSYLDP